VLLLIPALLALLLALARGGSLRHLADLRVRGSGLIATSFLIQLVLYLPMLRHSAAVLQLAFPIYSGALGLAVAGILCNWRLGVALRLVAVGLALNVTVITLNGGHMPANAAAVRAVQGEAKVRELANAGLYGNTRLATPSSRLVWLSDVIPVRIAAQRGNVYSVGDGLIALGTALLMYTTTRRCRLPVPTPPRTSRRGPSSPHANPATGVGAYSGHIGDG